jgi:hypothetical protein
MNITLRKLSESLLDKLIDLAKQYDYDTFLNKTDSINNNILYRSMSIGNVLKDNCFMTDWIGHAREYGDEGNIDGIVYNSYKEVMFFDDNKFNELTNYFKKTITKKELVSIYSYYFKNIEGYISVKEKNKIMSFVFEFINFSKPYSSVQKNPRKNDLLIPIMLHYAKLNDINIISFEGGDFYGDQNEFVVNDISKYPKLSDIWKSVNR